MAARKPPARLIIKESLGCFEFPYMENVDNLIKRLTDYKAAHPNFINIYVDTDHNWDNTDLNYIGEREETDEEYEARLFAESVARSNKRKAKAERLSAEKAEYERLKKKFG